MHDQPGEAGTGAAAAEGRHACGKCGRSPAPTVVEMCRVPEIAEAGSLRPLRLCHSCHDSLAAYCTAIDHPLVKTGPSRYIASMLGLFDPVDRIVLDVRMDTRGNMVEIA